MAPLESLSLVVGRGSGDVEPPRAHRHSELLAALACKWVGGRLGDGGDENSEQGSIRCPELPRSN